MVDRRGESPVLWRQLRRGRTIYFEYLTKPQKKGLLERAVRDEARAGHENVNIEDLPEHPLSDDGLLYAALMFMREKDLGAVDRRDTWLGLQLAQFLRRIQRQHANDLRNNITRRGVPSLHQEEYTFGQRFQLGVSNDEVEQVTAAPDFDPSQLFLKRVTATVNWAVHGLIFEFVGKERMGCIVNIRRGGTSFAGLNDETIAQRSGVGWTDIDYGDYIVGIHGNRVATPHDRTNTWLCHSVTLEFASGRTICYASNHSPWKGESFTCKVPKPCLVYRITFGHGQSTDICASSHFNGQHGISTASLPTSCGRKIGDSM